jgi:uncharacterized RDD family membrane protein YckC
VTCQHCQTWILDDDHRCRRCGRRVRNTPSRISPETYPIAATATAPAYEYYPPAGSTAEPQRQNEGPASAQQPLFAMTASEPRVIAFDSLTTPTQRESIRARAAEIARPAPLKTEKIEAPRLRPRSTAKSPSQDQHRLDFRGEQQLLAPPQSSIICDAPVAPPSLRVRAALIDAILIVIGCSLALTLFRFLGGQFSFDKHLAPFLLLALATVPLCYKLLWTFAGRDSVGMRSVGLQLIDFDGNRPSQARRCQRLFGMLLSFLAAGLGLLWVFVDEDGLSWHDHISSTFPTIISRD